MFHPSFSLYVIYHEVSFRSISAFLAFFLIFLLTDSTHFMGLDHHGLAAPSFYRFWDFEAPAETNFSTKIKGVFGGKSEITVLHGIIAILRQKRRVA